MTKFFRCCVLAAALGPVAASAAAAGELNLTIADGRVTLIAQDVTVRQILAEWARVGQTKIVNGDKMMGPPMTIELRNVPEAKALETILRSAAGYMVAPRPSGQIGMSSYDAVVILPTSRPPVVTASAPPSFTNPRPQPVMPQVEERAEPDNDQQPPMPPTGPQGQQFPGQPVPGPTQMNQPANTATRPGPMTSPVPGQLPPPPPAPGNPYQPQPGTRPPVVPGQPTPARPGGGGGGGLL